VSAVEITGVEALRRRFEAASAPERFKTALRDEVEAIAAEARREAPGDLARSIEVEDVSRAETIVFAVGTPNSAGRATEFGTLARPANPWLWPVLKAHLPGIKDKLRNIALGPFKKAGAGF
jgi:hypothetical protein